MQAIFLYHFLSFNKYRINFGVSSGKVTGLPSLRHVSSSPSFCMQQHESQDKIKELAWLQ